MPLIPIINECKDMDIILNQSASVITLTLVHRDDVIPLNRGEVRITKVVCWKDLLCHPDPRDRNGQLM